MIKCDMSIWSNINKRSEGNGLRREEIIFQPMVYAPYRESEIIARNIYKGVEYFVVNIGTHPCAYVVCDKEFLDNHKDEWGDIDGISVHGGVTYTDKLSDLSAFCGDPELKEVYCFGWDYGHAGDWSGYLTDLQNNGSRKYTTEMVVEDCKDVIDQYLKILEKDKQVKEITDDWEEVESMLESLDFDDIDDLFN